MRLLCSWWRHDGRSLLSRPADSVRRSPHSVWIQSRAKCSYRVPFHSFFRFPLSVVFFCFFFSSSLFSLLSLYITFLSLSPLSFHSSSVFLICLILFVFRFLIFPLFQLLRSFLYVCHASLCFPSLSLTVCNVLFECRSPMRGSACIGIRVWRLCYTVIAMKKASVCPKVMELHKYHRHRRSPCWNIPILYALKKKLVRPFAVTGFLIGLENLYTPPGIWCRVVW